MIVDMIRNDLGRVAEIGSVAVPQLFAVERYPTLLQMTSTVVARTSASITEILAADVSLRLDHRRAQGAHHADYPGTGATAAWRLYRRDRFIGPDRQARSASPFAPY
jgi:hypothetical protein